MWVGSRAGGEGAGLLGYAAIASLVVGIATYPLCRFRLPRVFAAVVSCMGLLLLVMYCMVFVRMAQR